MNMCHFGNPHGRVFSPRWAVIPEQGQRSRHQAVGTAQQGTLGSCSRGHAAPARPEWERARCTAHAAGHRRANQPWAAGRAEHVGETWSAGRGVRELGRSPGLGARGAEEARPASARLHTSPERPLRGEMEPRVLRKETEDPPHPLSTATISSNICRQHFQNASKKKHLGGKRKLQGWRATMETDLNTGCSREIHGAQPDSARGRAAGAERRGAAVTSAPGWAAAGPQPGRAARPTARAAPGPPRRRSSRRPCHQAHAASPGELRTASSPRP